MRFVRRVPVCLAVACLPGVISACGASSTEDSNLLLSASQVGGEKTGSGTDLLVPAAKSCKVDGDFLWRKATDGDVRAFEREVDGHTEEVVVGAWPMSEEAAEKALNRITAGPRCNEGPWTVESTGIGTSPGQSATQSFEVRKRDASGEISSWKVRAYTYTEGHMIAVWSERTDSEPSIDGVRKLLRKQEDQLSDDS